MNLLQNLVYALRMDTFHFVRRTFSDRYRLCPNQDPIFISEGHSCTRFSITSLVFLFSNWHSPIAQSDGRGADPRPVAAGTASLSHVGFTVQLGYPLDPLPLRFWRLFRVPLATRRSHWSYLPETRRNGRQGNHILLFCTYDLTISNCEYVLFCRNSSYIAIVRPCYGVSINNINSLVSNLYGDFGRQALAWKSLAFRGSWRVIGQHIYPLGLRERTRSNVQRSTPVVLAC
jgi:hypothetical protein